MKYSVKFLDNFDNLKDLNDIRNRIANNVKRLRVDKKLRREELSLLLGFDNSYISKLERGSVNITIDRLSKIAEYFAVDASVLLKD